MSTDTPATQRIPPDPVSLDSVEPAGFGDAGGGDPGAGGKASSRTWLSWTALIVVIVAVLFCFGQLGLIMPLDFPSADTHSRMKADYNLWPEVALQPVSAGVIEDVRRGTPNPGGQLIVNGEYWGSPTVGVLPTLTPSPSPTLSATPPAVVLAAATSTPPRLLQTPVPPPTATRLQNQPTPRPTRTNPPPGRLPTSTSRPTSTFFVQIDTDTPRPRYKSPTPTNTATRTPTSTLTRTPTQTFTATWTATTTLTPTPTFTLTPSYTPTPSSTLTPSNTPTASYTPTFTLTPTLTGTPTFTPTPTPTKTPVGNIGEGTPDATWEPIRCGDQIVIDFGAPRQINSLVFYEFFNPADGCGQWVDGVFTPGICMDELQVWLSNTPDRSTGQVFFWGDNNPNNNGFIFPYHHRATLNPREIDNEGLPWVELFPSTQTDPQYRTGVCIDVPDGSYRYLIFYVPYNPPPPGVCNDEGEIDAFEINIDLNGCPVPAAQTADQRYSSPR